MFGSLVVGANNSLVSSDNLYICPHPTSLWKLETEAHTRQTDLRPKKHYWAVLPPSTRYDAPVMNDALSEARNMMAWAISSGLPTRLSGTVAARPAFLSSVPVKRFSIPVSIGPGATMLTRTAEEAASSAADLVSPSTACLLAAYTDAPAAPVWPYVDDTLTMLPCPWTSITRISCFMLRSVPRTFVSKVAA